MRSNYRELPRQGSNRRSTGVSGVSSPLVIPPPPKKRKRTPEAEDSCTQRHVSRISAANGSPRPNPKYPAASSTVPSRLATVAVQNKLPNIENHSNGSRGLTNLKPFNARVILPPWLSSEQSDIPLPALPVLSDPEAFRTIFEARRATTTINTPGKKPDTKKRKHNDGGNNSTGKRENIMLRPEFSESFKDMAYHGDRRLRPLCERLIFEIFGSSLRKLGKLVADDWQSNDNWLFLAIVYGLPQLVGKDLFPPGGQNDNIAYNIAFEAGKGLTGNKQKRNMDYAMLKSLADVWEAYWEGVLQERKLWGDSLDDIDCFFMRLLRRKYSNLMMFAQGHDLENTVCIDNTIRETTMYNTRTVRRSDQVFAMEFGKADGGGGETNEYGSLVSFPEMQHTCGKIGSQRFAIEEHDAAIKLLYAHWDGLQPLPIGEDYEGNEAGEQEEIRYRMFDIMISEWCGQPVPLGPEALQSALERIRALRVDLIKRQTSKVSVDSSTKATNDKRLVLHKDKLIARSFWYESRLTFSQGNYKETVSALFCVILSILLNDCAPSNTELLNQCIQRINTAYAKWWHRHPSEVIHGKDRNVSLKTTRAPSSCRFRSGTLTYCGEVVWKWGAMEDVGKENVWNALNVQIDENKGEEGTAEAFAVSFLKYIDHESLGTLNVRAQ